MESRIPGELMHGEEGGGGEGIHSIDHGNYSGTLASGIVWKRYQVLFSSDWPVAAS